MKAYQKPGPSVLVIFGAAGDLTHRKLVPAMHNLMLQGFVPEKFAMIGIDKKELSHDQFREQLKEGVKEFSSRTFREEDGWDEFASNMCYMPADFNDKSVFQKLASCLEEQDRNWQEVSNKVFYFAIPPAVIELVAMQLGAAGLAADREHSRIVVEKPFGYDYNSAHNLNLCLLEIFDESQIYRIDHYLGKETVQNIMAFRFANSLFEPIWNRHYIDHVQITVAEQIGVGHRGGYYEHAGALRDMVQNHLFQLLCLIAMESPVNYDADEVRNRKVDVLRAIRPISPEEVHSFAVRGQYGSGWIGGEHVKAYRDEEYVDPNSNVETFAAVKLFVDNWRWQDIPFYLRTGKRLYSRISEVTIQFKPVPHQAFPSIAVLQSQPNRLVLRIQPQEGIVIRFQAKQPGEAMMLRPVDMKFSYKEAFKTPPPEAYETLLLDVMLGDSTQFMRADQLEIAWSALQTILEQWELVRPTDFPNYPAGSWGPEQAAVLIAQDGRIWLLPSIQEEYQTLLHQQMAGR